MHVTMDDNKIKVIMENLMLDSTQKYAAAALFALALKQSQNHQCRITSTLPSLDDEPISPGMSASTTTAPSSVSDRPYLWIHEDSGLLFPVFMFMKVDDKAWDGLKETAGTSSQISHHVNSFLKLLYDESSQNSDVASKEIALLKAVDTMVEARNEAVDNYEERSEDKYICCDKYLDPTGCLCKIDTKKKSFKEKQDNTCGSETCELPVEDAGSISAHRKLTILYELLCACILGSNVENKNNGSKSVKGYDSRHRVALRLLATWLDVSWIKMEALEIIWSCTMMDLIRGDVEKRDDDGNDPWSKWKQGSLIGGTALAGGAVLAISSGLAAPAIASGIGAMAPTLGSLLPSIGAGGFAAAASTVGSLGGSAVIAASFGAVGAGLCGSKMAKRIGDIEHFDFKPIHNYQKGYLAVGIMVSGLIFEEDDFVKPWERQKYNLESYALHWEFNNLITLTTAFRDLIVSKIHSELMSLGAMVTVLSTMFTALSVPAALMTATDMIDSNWAIALDRSDKVGKLLAEVLLEGHHGNRPVTLIGFSVGARVVFKCLQYLAETGDHDGLVERVVLLGAPVSLNDEDWKFARKMVSGRFINVYSTDDWTLGIAFRTNLVSQGLAGIQPVDAPGIENVDVTHIIDGHSSYIWMTEHILKQLDLDTYYSVWKDVDVETIEKEASVKPPEKEENVESFIKDVNLETSAI